VLSVINTMLACCDSLDVIAAYLNGRPDHQRPTQNAGRGGASALLLPAAYLRDDDRDELFP
jgi:hypothetical protein